MGCLSGMGGLRSVQNCYPSTPGAGAAVAKAPPAKRPNSGNGRGQTHNSCHVIHPLQTIVSRIQRHTMTRSPMIHLAHHVIGSTSCASVV